MTEDFREGRILEMEYLGEKDVLLGIKGDNMHPKALGNPDDMETNVSSTDHPECLVLKVKSHETLDGVVSFLAPGVGFVYIARKCQNESKGVLGYGVFSVVGDIGYSDPAFVTGWDINVIKAGRASEKGFGLGEEREGLCSNG